MPKNNCVRSLAGIRISPLPFRRWSKLNSSHRGTTQLIFFTVPSSLIPHNGLAYLWLSKVERGSERKLYEAVSGQVQTQTAIAVSQGRIAMAQHTVGPEPADKTEVKQEEKTAILSTEPSSLAFGSQSGPKSQSVQLTNSGSKRLSIRKVSLDAAPEFTILSDQCTGRTLNSGGVMCDCSAIQSSKERQFQRCSGHPA